MKFSQREDRGRPASGAASQLARLMTSTMDEIGQPIQDETIGDMLLHLLASWDIGEHNNVPGRQGLTIATVEAAAGSQWRYVWLIDASDRVIPGSDAKIDEDELAHGLRRFYVACTRAADKLFCANARGGGLGFEATPTRFLQILGRPGTTP